MKPWSEPVKPYSVCILRPFSGRASFEFDGSIGPETQKETTKAKNKGEKNKMTNTTFGIELEFTGITMKEAAEITNCPQFP